MPFFKIKTKAKPPKTVNIYYIEENRDKRWVKAKAREAVYAKYPLAEIRTKLKIEEID